MAVSRNVGMRVRYFTNELLFLANSREEASVVRDFV